jgi:hypothetical protein
MAELVTAGSGTIFFDTTANLLKTLTVNTGGNLSLGNLLNIAPGSLAGGYGTVTVNGTLRSNGFLTLQSDTNGTARVGASIGIIDGDVTVERLYTGQACVEIPDSPFAGRHWEID